MRVELHLFGSCMRDEADDLSDRDILAIVERTPTVADRIAVTERLRGDFGPNVAVSWYSRDRIAEMFATGHLFAWHLHRESKLIGHDESTDTIAQLGAPQAYRDSSSDIEELIGITQSIPEQLAQHPGNSAFEAGLLYICARNIALASSWHMGTLDFSRYSPFYLRGDGRTVPFPLSRSEYEALIVARLAPQRGLSFTTPEADSVMRQAQLVTMWAASCQLAVRERLERTT